MTTTYSTTSASIFKSVSDALRESIVLAVLAAAIFCSPNTASADFVFSAANDFSIANNPNGAWGYGYSTSLSGSLILHTLSDTSSGLDSWYTTFPPFNVPSIYRNTAATVYSDTHVVIQPGQLVLHPGSNNEYEKVRLTIPTASTYRITGAFLGVDFSGPTTTDVHVLVNGTAVFNGFVGGFGAGPSFDFTVPLGASDTIDFAVGFGSNGNFFNDSTALTATITAVPEPSTAILVVIGLPLVARMRRLRNRRG